MQSSAATLNLMLHSKIYVAILLFAIVSVESLWGQCFPIDTSLTDGRAFISGEKLTYVAQYRLLGISTDVGFAEVTLHDGGLKDGRTLLHPVAYGKSYKFWDAFFKVRDKYESVFYEESCRPIFFHRDIHEGKYSIQNFYEWEDSTHAISAKIVRPKYTRDTLLPGKECTFDILTLFYNARNINFEAIQKGVNTPVSFAIDDEIFDIYFRYIGKEEKRIPKSGVYRTMKFAAKVVAGEVFTGEQEMIIWVTDDRNRVPLLFESPIIVGSVVGRLSAFEGLKYPMDCKIK